MPQRIENCLLPQNRAWACASALSNCLPTCEHLSIERQRRQRAPRRRRLRVLKKLSSTLLRCIELRGAA